MNRILLGDLDVSRFCLGCMPFGVRIVGDAVDTLADRFREVGGNFFDTAHCYAFWAACGYGASERFLGDYIKRRGCRSDVVIATKGGHPGAVNYRTIENYLSPGRVAADIDDSLARLKTDVIDLYWLHRDDPRLGVGEILESLHAEVRRGRIRCMGASNWTSRRLEEAARYAAEHRIPSFVASQPKWSLLDYPPMTEEERLKPGALLHLNAADADWHARSRMPVVPYGPTGNGFFATGGIQPESFRNAVNAARVKQVNVLAAKHGATPNQVALAWLLHQPFPVIPILGTSQVAHLDDALGALRLSLSAEDVRQLAVRE